MTGEYVILVDEENNQTWTMEKLEAHQKWVLHRAFSIFLFNQKGELLIQQRDIWKYHCWGLWSNTVCSHQREWEETLDASVRRLDEELGIIYEKEDLEEVGSEIYRAEFNNGLTEHEYDFIVIGKYNEWVVMNPEEVMNYQWISIPDLKNDMEGNPEEYTPWFKIIMQKKYFYQK